MNALFSPVSPLSIAFADAINATFSAARRALASEPAPSWTEYLHSCNKG